MLPWEPDCGFVVTVTASLHLVVQHSVMGMLQCPEVPQLGGYQTARNELRLTNTHDHGDLPIGPCQYTSLPLPYLSLVVDSSLFLLCTYMHIFYLILCSHLRSLLLMFPTHMTLVEYSMCLLAVCIHLSGQPTSTWGCPFCALCLFLCISAHAASCRTLRVNLCSHVLIFLTPLMFPWYLLCFPICMLSLHLIRVPPSSYLYSL